MFAILYLVLLAAAHVSLEDQNWVLDFNTNIQNINNINNNMKSFFEDQRNKVEKVLNLSYQNAVKMKDSVNNYVEENQKKISEEINKYVESIKENGEKMKDSWSYLPTEEPGAMLDNPEATLSVPALIARHGYTCETHTVNSQGYLLNTHRIPRSKNGNKPSGTVLLQHGLFASSADWIINGPEKALAYVLADAGYDVWMTNIRGNRYSREHATLKTNSKTYWNFSWHDVALYDVPAVIDYILDIKNSGTKITYIGHSMGTTILFAMLSLRPEYNLKLTNGIALAPEVFLSDVRSPLKSWAPIASNVAYMEMLYGSHEFIPKNSALGKLTTSCSVDNMDFVICKNLIFSVCGSDEEQFNKTLLPIFLSHLGTGVSWKTVVHFAQEVTSGGNFQQFDYGAVRNRRLYGSETPPEYDLSQVSLPLTLFWAQNDLLSSENDVQKLYHRLPPTTELYMVPYADFNHLDYLWAVDAPRLVNDKILETLKKFHTNATFSIGGLELKFV